MESLTNRKYRINNELLSTEVANYTFDSSNNLITGHFIDGKFAVVSFAIKFSKTHVSKPTLHWNSFFGKSKIKNCYSEREVYKITMS